MTEESAIDHQAMEAAMQRKQEITRDLEILEKHTPPDLLHKIKEVLVAQLSDELRSIFLESTIFTLHMGRALGQHDLMRQQMENKSAAGVKPSALLMKLMTQTG